MNCPSCGADVSSVMASAGGHARAESLTKTERKAIAALGGLAAAKRGLSRPQCRLVPSGNRGTPPVLSGSLHRRGCLGGVRPRLRHLRRRGNDPLAPSDCQSQHLRRHHHDPTHFRTPLVPAYLRQHLSLGDGSVMAPHSGKAHLAFHKPAPAPEPKQGSEVSMTQVFAESFEAVCAERDALRSEVEELKAGLPAREDVVITLTVRAERAERALGDAEERVKELEDLLVKALCWEHQPVGSFESKDDATMAACGDNGYNCCSRKPWHAEARAILTARRDKEGGGR